MTNPAAPAETTFPEYHAAKQAALLAFEKDYLTLLFALIGDNIAEAARVAGVDRTTLYALMERHGISKKISL